jgi:hypothetical protein
MEQQEEGMEESKDCEGARRRGEPPPLYIGEGAAAHRRAPAPIGCSLLPSSCEWILHSCLQNPTYTILIHTKKFQEFLLIKQFIYFNIF